MASMGLNIEEQKAVERFQKEVVSPSQDKLVVLDFWAEWCGPCKALTPVLEKVCGEYADKGVVLAKLNVDEDQFIASQFQVRSIPTVYAIFQGQPVADLTPMRSESQLKEALDQLLTQLPVKAGAADGADTPQADIPGLVAMGEQVLAEGDGERAAGIFQQIAAMAPEEAGAHSGLIRALVAAGRTDEARAAYEALSDALRAGSARQPGAQRDRTGRQRKSTRASSMPCARLPPSALTTPRRSSILRRRLSLPASATRRPRSCSS